MIAGYFLHFNQHLGQDGMGVELLMHLNFKFNVLTLKAPRKKMHLKISSAEVVGYK